MGWLSQVEKFLDGKKAYSVAITGAILIGWHLYTGQPIPDWVWKALEVLGLGAVRSAIGNK